MQISRTLNFGIVLFITLVSVCPAFASDKETINIVGSDWPVWETARAMDAIGMAPKNTKYHDRSLKNSFLAFRNKKMDAGFFTLYGYLRICRDKKIEDNTQIIMVTDFSHGGDMMVVRPHIKNPADLKGKRIGIDQSTLSMYLLDLILRKKGGLNNIGEVRMLNIRGEKADIAFSRNKNLDAVVTWNPAGYHAAHDHGGKYMYSSADFPAQLCDLLVVWKDSLEKHRDTYKEYMKTWYKALKDRRILEKQAEIHHVGTEEFSSWLEDAKIYKTPEESLAAVAEIRKTIKDIDHYFENNSRYVPKNIAKDYKPRQGKNLFDLSLMKEIIAEGEF